MKKPKVTTRCPAAAHAAANERIVEFSGAHGVGGLISIRQGEDGRIFVELYRLDPEVKVSVPSYALKG